MAMCVLFMAAAAAGLQVRTIAPWPWMEDVLLEREAAVRRLASETLPLAVRRIRTVCSAATAFRRGVMA